MNGKITFALLSIGVLAFACGRPRSADSLANVRVKSSHGPALTPLLNVSTRDGVRFDFTVSNTGNKKLEVNFPSGQTHDLIVLDSLGREVWRWSEKRVFTAALQNKVMREHDTLSFADEWTDAAPGRYTAIAKLASANYPMERRADFVVR
jgi:hypothetical protein